MAEPNGREGIEQTQTNADDEGVAPSFSSPAEQQAFQSALLSQLQSAQAVAASRAGDASVAAAAPVDDVQSHVNTASSCNLHHVLCRFCDTKILLADAATFIDKELPLHHLGGSKDDPARETLRDYWLVTSQMHFENVGVTRSVDPSYRYLTCANCDRGPVGINFFAEPTRFYVAHARIKYAQ